MATMCLGVFGKFYRESVHHTPGLYGDDVIVNVMSEIPGNLKWLTTNKSYLTITVKVSATSFDVLNSTDILFTSGNSSIFLDIRTSGLQEPAAVYSTGSRNNRFTGSRDGVIILLLWAAVVILDWRGAHVAMLMLMFQAFVGASLDTTAFPHSVDIIVEAPSHIRYKSINLMVNKGTIRLENEIFKHQPEQEVRCMTDQSTKGCDHCCYGHGVCFNNTCICDESFDSDANCKTFIKQDVLYVNPLDPRLSKTILPNGVILDMSPASNSKDNILHEKGQAQSKLRVRTKDSDFSDVVFHFEESGLLKRVRYNKSSFILWRNKTSSCYFNVVIKKSGKRHSNFVVNLCNISDFNITDPTEVNLGHDYRTLTRHGHLLNIDRIHKRFRARKNVKEIPVKFVRCGYDTQNDVSIYFKVNKDDVNTQSYPHHLSDDIYLHTTYSRKTHQLRLPARNVSDKDIHRKCERSMAVRINLCKSEHLTLYSLLCDSIITSINDTEYHATTGTDSKAVNMCYFLAETLNDYCASIISNGDSRKLSCLSQYTETVDLFATYQLTLSPTIVLQNGETVTQKDIVIQRSNNSNSVQIEEIVLKEDLPVFKILNIAVIPKDPVPEDIYKVRMDYACATNETVIYMNVTGSDKYSSHVTCHGVTECNCCVVHAAGAADAVIDYVTISVTDVQANTDIHREMVVIF